MDRIALVTANFGGIDPIHPLPDHDRNAIGSFYYTGQDYWEEPGYSTWDVTICPSYPRRDLHPRLRAKYFKLQIHRLPEVSTARWLAWADSSLVFNSLYFLSQRAEEMLRFDENEQALFVPHPDRKTVQEEYDFICARMKAGDRYLIERYGEENMLDQMVFLEKRVATSSKLWCGGFWMVRNTALYHGFLNDWWDQSLRFSIMDQLPIGYLLSLHGIRPQVLDVNIYSNAYFKWARRTS